MSKSKTKDPQSIPFPVVESLSIPVKTTAEFPARLLTVQQAAAYLAASVWAIRRLLMRGEIPTIRVGKRYNVAREDLDAWVDARKAGGAA